MIPEPQAKTKQKLQSKYQLPLLKAQQKEAPQILPIYTPRTEAHQSLKSLFQHMYWGPKSAHPWLQETELTAIKIREKVAGERKSHF